MAGFNNEGDKYCTVRDFNKDTQLCAMFCNLLPYHDITLSKKVLDFQTLYNHQLTQVAIQLA